MRFSMKTRSLRSSSISMSFCDPLAGYEMLSFILMCTIAGCQDCVLTDSAVKLARSRWNRSWWPLSLQNSSQFRDCGFQLAGLGAEEAPSLLLSLSSGPFFHCPFQSIRTHPVNVVRDVMPNDM